ncbi:MAG TPA: RNA polymerase sigma factor, partial [Polyangia bacterium]
GTPALPPPDASAGDAGRPAASSVPAPDPATRAPLDEADRRTLLGSLMRAHGDEIFRFCFSMLGDRSLADDVHQSVFVDAFQALATLSDRGRARAWLYGIARHRCLDAAKARRRWNWRFVLAPDAGHGEAAQETASIDEPSDANDPRQAALLACLRDLAPHVRAAVLLRYEEGLPYEEIARMSRERAPTLQMRVARGLVGLRACIAKKLQVSPTRAGNRS